MSEETETGTQTFDSSFESLELGLKQECELEPTVHETPPDALTLRSVDEKIKQATDPILRRVELGALLASRMEMKPAVNSEASGSRRNHESSSPSRNRYDRCDFSSCKCQVLYAEFSLKVYGWPNFYKIGRFAATFLLFHAFQQPFLHLNREINPHCCF